jgi:MFS family permease
VNGTQRRVLTTTCLAHGLIHVYELSIPALLWMIQTEFGANDLRMGEIATFYALLFGVGSLPAGWLVDRVGSRLLLLVCLVGSSLCMVGMAVSPGLTAFAFAAAGMGLCLSIYHPAGTALITHAMPPSGRVFAWHGMAGNSGVAAASALAGLLGAWLGWRWALGSLAVLGVVLALNVLRLPSPTVHEIRSRPGEGNWKGFALLLIATAFMGMVYRGITTFLPKFFAVSYTDDLTRGTALGGVLTTAALLVGLAGMYTAGRLVDRGHHAAFVFLIGATCQMPLLVALRWIAGPAMVPLFMSVAFFHFFTQPAGNKLVAQLTPPRLRGLGYGIYFLMTFGAGSFGGVIGGWISKRQGLASVFPGMAVLIVPALVAIILLWLIFKPGPQEDVPTPESL